MPIRRDGEKLLQPNLVREYTEEEIGELIKCSEDIYYFTKRYVKIVHPVRGFIKMEPYPYQYDILELAKNEKFILLLLPRQSGKCLNFKNNIKVRNKKTGKVEELPIGKFYERIKSNKEDR